VAIGEASNYSPVKSAILPVLPQQFPKHCNGTIEIARLIVEFREIPINRAEKLTATGTEGVVTQNSKRSLERLSGLVSSARGALDEAERVVENRTSQGVEL
jgi:hypothetical protein